MAYGFQSYKSPCTVPLILIKLILQILELTILNLSFALTSEFSEVSAPTVLITDASCLVS